jgi:hypothetical protein
MHPINLSLKVLNRLMYFFSFLNHFACRASRRRKTIIHRNQRRNHIQEVVQVGVVGLLEEEGADGVGIAVAVDGDSVLREVLVPTTHL